MQIIILLRTTHDRAKDSWINKRKELGAAFRVSSGSCPWRNAHNAGIARTRPVFDMIVSQGLEASILNLMQELLPVSEATTDLRDVDVPHSSMAGRFGVNKT